MCQSFFIVNIYQKLRYISVILSKYPCYDRASVGFVYKLVCLLVKLLRSSVCFIQKLIFKTAIHTKTCDCRRNKGVYFSIRILCAERVNICAYILKRALGLILFLFAHKNLPVPRHISSLLPRLKVGNNHRSILTVYPFKPKYIMNTRDFFNVPLKLICYRHCFRQGRTVF